MTPAVVVVIYVQYEYDSIVALKLLSRWIILMLWLDLRELSHEFTAFHWSKLIMWL